MKKFFCILFLLAFISGTAGCTGTPLSSLQDNRPPAPSSASDSAASLNPNTRAPVCFLGQGEPLGDSNADGYYYMKRNADASFIIRYIDYASRTEITLCSRPECTHDNDSCSAWRPYGGSSGCAVPIDGHLYTIFYGSQNSADYTRYGESAIMRVEKSSLDGNGTDTLMSLSASEFLTGGIAADTTNLYMTIASVEKTEGGDVQRFYQIYTMDLQSGAFQKSEPMEETDIRIVGAVNRKLILCYCEMGQQLADTVTKYCTYDIDTHERADIPFPINADAICTENYLCWIDKEQGTLQKADVLSGNILSLPLNLDISCYEDIRLCYCLPHYLGVLLYKADQPIEHGLIALESGTLYPLLLKMDTPEDMPAATIPIFAEVDDQTFLTAQSFSYRPVPFSSDEVPVYLPVMDYTFAMLPLESCLSNLGNYIPIKQLDS